MSKELEAIQILVEKAIYGNKENNRGKIFEAEKTLTEAIIRKEELEKRDKPVKMLKKQEINTDEGIYYAYLETIYGCPICRLRVGEDFEFCPHCGNKLDKNKDEIQST